MTSHLGWPGRKPAASSVPLPASPAPWASQLFASELVPSVVEGTDVLVWSIRNDASTATISDQFKANAGDYHQRYATSGHFEDLFRRALAEADITVVERPLILDLGSGSGVNSIVPCMRLFPGAQCIATDLSGELLSMLAGYLRQAGNAEAAICVQMDAMSDHMTSDAFDLVTGASILHHLERPLEAFIAAARVLRPGGHAIFFEPFEGYGILRLAYERILSEAKLRGEALHPDVERTLGNLIIDIAARTNPDTTSPSFCALDDKWLFSREAVSEMAARAGFADVNVLPHNSEANLYQLIAPIQLRLATGRSDLPLPKWAMAVLKSFDEALPATLKRAAMLEGTIVLTKAS